MNKKLKISTEMSGRFHSFYSDVQRCYSTLQFGQLLPMTSHATIPHDQWRLKPHVDIKLAPLVVPSRAKIYYNTAGFYVRYNQVDSLFDSLVSDKQRTHGQPIDGGIYSTLTDICEFFFGTSNTSEGARNFALTAGKVSTGESKVVVSSGDQIFKQGTYDIISTAYDDSVKACHGQGMLVYVIVGQLTSGYVFLPFTERAYRWIKTFEALGFHFPCPCLRSSSQNQNYNNPIYFSTSVNDNSLKDLKVSMYPLLCFVKAYVDWFANPALIEDHPVSTIMHHVYNRNRDTNLRLFNSLSGDTHHMYFAKFMSYVFNDIVLNIRPDEFTRSTQKLFNHLPYSAGSSTNSSQVKTTIPSSIIPGAPMPSESVVDGTSGEYVSLSGLSTSNVGYFTKLINSVTKHLMLNRVVGGRAIDRFRAQFGLTNKLLELQRSVYLGITRTPIGVDQINVSADAYSSGNLESQAGQYVGQGFGKSNSMYKVSADNFGQVIIMHWLTADPVYLRNFDRELLKTNTYDWYNETLDGLGYAQPKSTLEYVIRSHRHVGFGNDVFGMEPQYEEYRNVAKDRVSGDFLRIAGMNAWYLPRDTNEFGDNDIVAETLAVRTYRQDTDEFNGIFQNPNGVDPFLIFADVETAVNRPISSRENALGLEAGSLSVDENGNYIS